MKNINKIRFSFLILIIYFITFFNSAYAKKYSEIKVTGNERLTLETIVIFSGLNLDTDINNQDLNNAIKNLFKTNYFNDIKITSNNDQIHIYIKENPIIQSTKITTNIFISIFWSNLSSFKSS